MTIKEQIIRLLYMAGESRQRDIYDCIGSNSRCIKRFNELRKEGSVKIISKDGLRTARLTSQGKKEAKRLFPDLNEYNERAKSSDTYDRYRSARNARVILLMERAGIPLRGSEGSVFFMTRQKMKESFQIPEEHINTRCNGLLVSGDTVYTVYDMDKSIKWQNRTEDMLFYEYLVPHYGAKNIHMLILVGSYDVLGCHLTATFDVGLTTRNKSQLALFHYANSPYENTYVICTGEKAHSNIALQLLIDDNRRDMCIINIADMLGITLKNRTEGKDVQGKHYSFMPVIKLNKLSAMQDNELEWTVICLDESMKDGIMLYLPQNTKAVSGGVKLWQDKWEPKKGIGSGTDSE